MSSSFFPSHHDQLNLRYTVTKPNLQTNVKLFFPNHDDQPNPHYTVTKPNLQTNVKLFFLQYEQFPHSGLMQASWQWARRSLPRRPLSPQDKQRGDSHGVSPRPSAVFTNRAELRRPSRARLAGERNLELIRKVNFRVPWAPSAVLKHCAEVWLAPNFGQAEHRCLRARRWGEALVDVGCSAIGSQARCELMFLDF